MTTQYDYSVEATFVDGVMRWNTNNRVPPKEHVELAAKQGYPVDVEKSLSVQQEEIDAFLEDYRKNYNGPTDEELAEARAAFGPGVVVVDVITGHKWKT